MWRIIFENLHDPRADVKIFAGPQNVCTFYYNDYDYIVQNLAEMFLLCMQTWLTPVCLVEVSSAFQSIDIQKLNVIFKSL